MHSVFKENFPFMFVMHENFKFTTEMFDNRFQQSILEKQMFNSYKSEQRMRGNLQVFQGERNAGGNAGECGRSIQF